MPKPLRDKIEADKVREKWFRAPKRKTYTVKHLKDKLFSEVRQYRTWNFHRNTKKDTFLKKWAIKACSEYLSHIVIYALQIAKLRESR